MTSLPPPRGYANNASAHMYSGNTHSAGHGNIPSRYRIGLRDAIRPIVVQPSRPSASPRIARRVLGPPQAYGSVPSTSEMALQTRNNSLSLVSHFFS